MFMRVRQRVRRTPSARRRHAQRQAHAPGAAAKILQQRQRSDGDIRDAATPIRASAARDAQQRRICANPPPITPPPLTSSDVFTPPIDAAVFAIDLPRRACQRWRDAVICRHAISRRIKIPTRAITQKVAQQHSESRAAAQSGTEVSGQCRSVTSESVSQGQAGTEVRRNRPEGLERRKRNAAAITCCFARRGGAEDPTTNIEEGLPRRWHNHQRPVMLPPANNPAVVATANGRTGNGRKAGRATSGRNEVAASR